MYQYILQYTSIINQFTSILKTGKYKRKEVTGQPVKGGKPAFLVNEFLNFNISYHNVKNIMFKSLGMCTETICIL